MAMRTATQRTVAAPSGAVLHRGEKLVKALLDIVAGCESLGSNPSLRRSDVLVFDVDRKSRLLRRSPFIEARSRETYPGSGTGSRLLRESPFIEAGGTTITRAGTSSSGSSGAAFN